MTRESFTSGRIRCRRSSGGPFRGMDTGNRQAPRNRQHPSTATHGLSNERPLDRSSSRHPTPPHVPFHSAPVGTSTSLCRRNGPCPSSLGSQEGRVRGRTNASSGCVQSPSTLAASSPPGPPGSPTGDRFARRLASTVVQDSPASTREISMHASLSATTFDIEPFMTWRASGRDRGKLRRE